jgi:hypothetical protein
MPAPLHETLHTNRFSGRRRVVNAGLSDDLRLLCADAR